MNRSVNLPLCHALDFGSGTTLSKDYPTGSTRPSIDLEYCEDVTIEDNRFLGFDWPIRIEQSNDTTRQTDLWLSRL